MAFLRNTTVNLLNLHYGIHVIALGGGGAFFAVYLLKAGVTAPMVFASIAVILLGRFVIRPVVVPLAVRWGLRALTVAGTVLAALPYLLLAEVHGVDAALAALVVTSIIGDTLYWTAYHAYFAALGDDEHRGQQIGMREAISAVVGIVSPLATGWLLVTFGPRAAFGAAATMTALSALPLFWTPEVTIARHVPGALKAGWRGTLLFAGDGWIAAGFAFAWQIALFLSLGESFVAYGGALAFAALAGAIGGLVLGRHIDAGHGKRAVAFALGVMALIIVLRALATGSATAAVLANALGALGVCLYIPTLMTAVYTQAKRSPCVLRFHVMTEGGWDLGGASGLFLTALLLVLGVPLWACILLSLAGVMWLAVLLRRYYGSSAIAAAALGS